MTLARLERLGIRTVGDLAALDERTLRGVARHELRPPICTALAWGRDERPVETDRDAKSIGHEETYPRDLLELGRARARAGAAGRRRRRRDCGVSGVAGAHGHLKVRFAGFRTITRSVTLPAAGRDGARDWWPRYGRCCGRSTCSEGVRLLGVSGSNLVAPAHQLNLLGDTEAPHRAAGAIDQIRERFGSAAIGPASAVGPPRGCDVVRKGAQQWGPDLPSEGSRDPPSRVEDGPRTCDDL